MRFKPAARPATPAKAKEEDFDPRRLQRLRTQRRVLFVVLLLILIPTALFINRCWIAADGIVVGNLVSINPLGQAKINKLDAHCLDYVSRGQDIAELSNELTVENAQQRLADYQLQLAQAKSAAEVARQEADAAKNYQGAQSAVQTQLSAVYKAADALVQQKYVGELSYQKAKSDVVKAEAETAAAAYVYQTKIEEAHRAELQAKLLEDQIASFQSSPLLMGSYKITAPKAGYLTQCNALEGQVVNQTTQLFSVFDPSDSYAILFLDPSDAARLDKDEEIEVSLNGVARPVHATVQGFFPELSGLPDQLTKYFWEKEKWSQYEPVRLNFVNLSDTEQRAVKASAKISVSLWRWPESGISGFVSSAFGHSARHGHE